MATVQEVAEAFVAGRVARCGNANSWYSVVDMEWKYTLHGSSICSMRISGVTKKVVFTFRWHGHFTATTANHMNKILDVLRRAGVTEKKFSYSVARKESEDSEWCDVDHTVQMSLRDYDAAFGPGK